MMEKISNSTVPELPLGSPTSVEQAAAAQEVTQQAAKAEQATPMVSKDTKGNYTTGDEQLDLLLGLTEDMAVGKACPDTGIWWLDTLEKILARLAPTTSTVSASDEIQMQLVEALRGFIAYAEACDDDSHEVDRAREALSAFDALRTVSASGSADTGSAG